MVTWVIQPLEAYERVAGFPVPFVKVISPDEIIGASNKQRVIVKGLVIILL
jgi:hypothetical protein